MTVLTASVLLTKRKPLDRGGEYLLVKYATKDGPRFASCFDTKLFEEIEKAKTPLAMLVEESKKLDTEGRPYMNIVGLEDKNQMRMF